MKKMPWLTPVFVLALFICSCAKNLPSDASKPSGDNGSGAPLPNQKAPACLACGGGTGGGTPPTDAQLEAYGLNLGCTLAKNNNGAPLYITTGTFNGIPQEVPNAIYGVFLNTVNNTAWPAVYTNAVREGWLNCYQSGPLLPGSCPMVVVSSGLSAWTSVNYCTWISGGSGGPTPPSPPIQ